MELTKEKALLRSLRSLTGWRDYFMIPVWEN
jgi:hypothetical protein